jgi:molecular chaperone Hsp33
MHPAAAPWRLVRPTRGAGAASPGGGVQYRGVRLTGPGRGGGRVRDLGSDYAVRAVAGEGSVLALAARTSRLCEEARRRHGCWPTAAAALGRALTAAALLAVPLKESQTLTIRILGDGPLGGLIAEGRAGGLVRGYARNTAVHLPLKPNGKLDVGGAVGATGEVHVTRDLGLRAPYTGSCPLVSGEIGEDMAAYLSRSEQVPSLVALGVLVAPDTSVRSAGGLVVQLLPGHEEEWAGRLDESVRALGGLSQLIDAGATPEAILETTLSGLKPRTLARQPLRFACTCGRDRVSRVLIALGPEELEGMLADGGPTELTCHFCGERYSFTPQEIGELLAAARGRGGRTARGSSGPGPGPGRPEPAGP